VTRYAITGATGFVGGHLIERLAGNEVSCLARGASEELARAGCRVVTGAISVPAALDALVSGADVVFHVAGAIAARSEAEFMAVNRDGTAAVARACARAGVKRLVYVSSVAVTGPSERGRPVDETAPPRPLTPYGRSKRAGEQAVRESGAAFTIVRPPIVYGPRDGQTLRLFRMAHRGLAPLVGDGAQELSLVHAFDLAEALVAAAASPAAAGGTYHAAHPEVVSQRALLEEIGRAVGRRPRLVPVPVRAVRAALVVAGAVARLTGRPTLLDPSKGPELVARAWTCAAEAIARDTGWRAQIPLARGLRETAGWYAAAGWL
jgi:nucleoside-diphosphate-sugar epimerase